MSFIREKRLLLAYLALGAPIPLPFNEVLAWPLLFLFWLLVILFIRRAEDPTLKPLSNTHLNLLGAAYLPFLAADVWTAASRGEMVPTLLHMILFVLLAKLFAIQQEKDKWQVLLAVFFVFVAAMATSSHVTIALYLLAAVGSGLWALARLAEWHTLSALGLEGSSRQTVVPTGRAFGALIAIVVGLAIPFFVALPRFTEPFLTSRAGMGLSMNRVSGFTDEVSLDGGGPITNSRAIALRVTYEEPILRPENLRFKGSAFDRYVGRRWLRDNESFEPIPPAAPQSTLFQLSPPNEDGKATPVVGSATLFLEPMPSSAVILPSEALSVDFEVRPSRAHRDGGGGMVLSDARLRTSPLIYRVELASQPVIQARLNQLENGQVAALDPSGITPRIAELARQIAGEGTHLEKVGRIEAYLQSEYGYTLDNSPPDGADPVEYFLFDRRAGHCELFATAMVLMLRSEGIPARFVTGFLGAEPNPLEDFHVVRQSNAHAWAEVYVEGQGWQVRDPTPAAGRPTVSPQSLALLAQQLYDYVIFRWDRYVLTYGATDQRSLREAISKVWESFRERWQAYWQETEAEKPSPGSAGTSVEATGTPTTVEPWRMRWEWLVAFLVIGGFAALWWLKRGSQREDARGLYVRLRRRLEQHSLDITPATPPLVVLGILKDLLPGQSPEVELLGRLYLAESFAGQRTNPEELRRLAAVLPVGLHQALVERQRAEAKAKRANRAAA